MQVWSANQPSGAPTMEHQEFQHRDGVYLKEVSVLFSDNLHSEALTRLALPNKEGQSATTDTKEQPKIERLNAEIADIEKRKERLLRELCQDTKDGLSFFKRAQFWTDQTEDYEQLQANRIKAIRFPVSLSLRCQGKI
jgi:hypothetical protein